MSVSSRPNHGGLPIAGREINFADPARTRRAVRSVAFTNIDDNDDDDGGKINQGRGVSPPSQQGVVQL